MRSDRWRIVVRLLEQVQSTAGRLVLAVAPLPLEVVLYEVPLLARTQPPHNPLRGFVQEAVTILGEATASNIASLLHLPQVVVDLVLGNLQQVGGLSVDSVGRWTVPDGGPIFRADEEGTTIWRRMRQLLCYWPDRNVMLPVLPRLRLRDLVELDVHQLQGDVRDWYVRFASLPGAEAQRRGLLDTLKLLPLVDSPAAPSEENRSVGTADAPIRAEDIMVSRCKLDVIALSGATKRDGVWELSSRLWCRPTPQQDSDGEPFAPGEPFVGLSLPEHLLGGGRCLDRLGLLFDPRPDAAWRTLLKEPAEGDGLDRLLQGDQPSIIVKESEGETLKQRWHGFTTTLAPEARLLCTCAQTVSREHNKENV